MMQSSISIKGLRIYAYHGVFPQETRVGNDFAVDAVLRFPCPGAIDSDRLDDTISYADVIEIIKAEMAVPSQLIEHVAGRIQRAVAGRYPQITGGEITVTKIRPPLTAELDSVSFTIAW